MAAILSCFVCSEKSNDMPKLTDMLSGPLRAMQDMAKKIARSVRNTTLFYLPGRVVQPKYLFFNPLHVVFKLLKPAQFANKKKNFFLSKSLIFDDLIETIFKDLQPYKQKVLI